MEKFQQQINNNQIALGRVARINKVAIPRFIERATCKDAGSQVERDGTGIGTGPDMECRPVLGGWYDLAQDVAPEQGCSTTLGIYFGKALPSEGNETVH
jgi:hypothetical protein